MTLVFLFTFAIGNVWAENITITWPMIDGENATSQAGSASVANIVTVNNATLSSAYTSLAWSDATQLKYSTDGTTVDIQFYAGGVGITNNPTNNKTTVNSNCYVEFTFDVKTGYTFTPTGFSFKMGRKGTDEGTAQGVLTLADATTSSVEVYQPARTDKKVNFNAQEKEITGASAFSAGSTVTFRVYMGGKVGGKSLYLADVKVEGTYAVSGGGGSEPEEDTTAPTLASSVPVNSATNVAVSGNIVLTMSENVSIADASKFSISGGAGSLTTASITASGAAVTVPYAELANSTAYTLTVAKGALKDAAENENEAFTVAFTTAASLAEPDYVLVRNNGTLNTDDFITGGTFENNKSWKVGDVTYTSGLKFNNASSSLQFNDNGRFVAYNTKTDAAHVDIAVYNTNSSATVVKVAIIRENADGSLTLVQDAEYNLAARTGSSSSNYVYGYWTGSFDLTGRSTMYVYEKSNSGRIRICQMAVYETGSNNNLAAPAIGYSVNLNKGRMFVAAATATTFEGLTYCLPNKYQPNNTASATIKAKGEDYISFTIPAGQARQLQVKASDSYNVSKTKGDESSYVSGNQNFNLTEGTWYINPNGSNVTITSIAFATAPTAYTVTYSKGDGSVKEGKTIPTQAATIEGGKFNVASGENLEKEGYDFAGWKYTPAVGDPVIYNAGQEFTMPAANVEFVAQWNVHETSDDVALGTLSVNGEAITIVPSQTVYAVELPFGTTATPTVTATANDENVKAFTITQATAVDGSATIYVKAEDNTTTKTYTINFTVADSKDLLLVFRTGTAACSDASTASAMLSDNAAVSSYINQITFNNVEGTGDNGKETGGGNGSLDVGKKAGNMLTLSAKPGYALQAMSFYGKIQDETCEYSLDGGDWTTLSSTNTGGDACYTVFSDEEVHEFRLRSTGAGGVWIRNMELTIKEKCTPIVVAWDEEPVEFEVGKSGYAIAATANNSGAVTYSSTDGDVIAVNGSTGALTVSALGSVTLKAATAEGDGTAYCANGGNNIEISKAVNTYYLVKLDAQNETDVTEVKYYAGDDAIALPTEPSYSGFVFQGWFDAASAGNAVVFPLTPESSRTIYAQWVAECTGPTINVHPASTNYLTGRTASALTCEATAGAAGELTYTWYSCDDAERTNPVVLAGAPTPSTAVAGTFYYYCAVTEAGCDIIRNSNVAMITVEDKDPVCIIKATPTSENEATADGAYKGDAAIESSNKKLSSKYDYVAVQLMEGKSFLATDKVVLNQAADLGDASDITKFYIYNEVPTANNLVVTVNNALPQKGDNWFNMPSEMAGQSALYIGRKDASCNPTVGYLAVYRVMNPELMAIKINGRDGEIDPQDDKHFYVTIPYEADLAALTVVPTIVSNTAEASVIKTVESNDGAWVLAENGDNTYRIKDKDGDYTDYTITLKRDVLKHAVKFYDGETLLETVEVEDGTQMAAGDVPADPTKEDYVFQGWAETDGGAVVDVTSFTISAAKNFYAKWVSDGAIKLIVDGTSGKELNTTNFLTGATLASSTVKVDNVDYAYATLGGTAGSPSNIDAANKVIAYHATTTQTKVMIDVFNTSNNSRPIKIMGVIEGSSDVTELATIDWPNSGDPRHIKTQYYEFNNTANRTIYITGTNTVSSVDFLQVKVIESGEQLKKAGEAGYSLNMNQGRLVGQSGLTIDGANIDLNSWYKPTNSTVAKLKETSIRFTVVNPVLLKVTAANNKEYYVTKGSAGTDNSTEKTGVSEFDLTAGTWYITAGGSEVQFTKIEFVAPKCEQPTIANMANSDLCEGDAFAELTVNASVNDEGTLHYAWYKEAGETDEAVGSDAATFTPEADGQYYVIVTNHKDNFTDNSKTSNTITVAHFASAQITTAPEDQSKPAGQNATLTVAASGKAPLSYQWYTCDENGDNAVIIAGAEAESYQVAVTASMHQYYKVVVSSGCGSAEAVALVQEWVDYAQVDVTGSMTWNFASSNLGLAADVEATSTMVLANAGQGVMPNNASFHSDMLVAIVTSAQTKVRASEDNGCYQGTGIKFHTTVPGVVTVKYRGTGNNANVKLTIGSETLETYHGGFTVSKRVIVPAGDVEITSEGTMRIKEIVFNAQADEERNVVIGNMGTVCLPNPSRAFGVNVYELAGKGEGCKVQFDQLGANEVLEAGKAYVLVMTDTKAKFFYTSDETADADWSTAMKGNLSATPIEFQPYDEAAKNVVFFKDNAMWNAYETGLRIKQYRAYLQYDEVTEPANSQPAPGRRRVSLNLNGAQVATGFDNLETSEAPMKVMIDGQLFIIRGEKMFDATGRLVK